MKREHKIFCNNPWSLIMAGLIISCFTTANAAVVQRGTASRAPVQRTSNAASRMPTITAAVANAAQTTAATEPTVDDTPTTTTPEPTTTDSDVDDEDFIIEDKTSQFDEILSDTTSSTSPVKNSELAENIKRQRAALDSQSAASTAAAQMQSALASGQNACDIGLRTCMKEKCGSNFLKCRGDGDTIWGDKMDACRRDLPCTGEEYRMFAAEIKADRDLNAKLDSYDAIINCGNEYNQCIETQCGVTFGKCLGKAAGDAAIAACAKIAKNCTQQDNGLASRTMNVFATLRVDAEKQVQRDEQRLYAMRDEMESQCKRLGAMFDQRSLTCVFTVEFYAGDKSTLYASKKAYAGSTFDCDPNWFGIDVTTFKENAYRTTREQQSATSAFMGAGLGVAAGAITSGAINRAIDTKKAKKALKNAQEEPTDGTDTDPQGGGDAESDTDSDAEKEVSPKEEEPKEEKDDKAPKTKRQIRKAAEQARAEVGTRPLDTSAGDKILADKLKKDMNDSLAKDFANSRANVNAIADSGGLGASSDSKSSGGSSNSSAGSSDGGSSGGGSSGGDSGGSSGGNSGGSSGGESSGGGSSGEASK